MEALFDIRDKVLHNGVIRDILGYGFIKERGTVLYLMHHIDRDKECTFSLKERKTIDNWIRLGYKINYKVIQVNTPYCWVTQEELLNTNKPRTAFDIMVQGIRDEIGI